MHAIETYVYISLLLLVVVLVLVKKLDLNCEIFHNKKQVYELNLMK
jgi:hypothetical protein